MAAKILAVEDGRNLRKEGCEVATAVDGAKALDFARNEKPNLIYHP